MKRSMAALAAVAGLVLAGCGGGDARDSGAPFIGSAGSGAAAVIPPAAPAPVAGPALEGYWTGTTGPYDFGVLGLPDGSMLVAYSRGTVLQGLMVGVADTTDTGLIYADVVDFNGPLNTVTTGTATGRYTPKGALTATVRLGSSTSYAFTAAYDASYDTVADLAQFAGTWSGTGGSSGQLVPSTVTLGADGSISGASRYCSYLGQVAPYSPGKNPLSVDVTFSGAQCALAGKTAKGVAVVRQIGAIQQLLTFGIASDGSDYFVGISQR